MAVLAVLVEAVVGGRWSVEEAVGTRRSERIETKRNGRIRYEQIKSFGLVRDWCGDCRADDSRELNVCADLAPQPTEAAAQ